jgi:hypothetical protein
MAGMMALEVFSLYPRLKESKRKPDAQGSKMPGMGQCARCFIAGGSVEIGFIGRIVRHYA